jgi:hypothetical protein
LVSLYDTIMKFLKSRREERTCSGFAALYMSQSPGRITFHLYAVSLYQLLYFFRKC